MLGSTDYPTSNSNAFLLEEGCIILYSEVDHRVKMQQGYYTQEREYEIDRLYPRDHLLWHT